MITTLAKNGTLHLGTGLRTRCGLPTSGMSPFESYTTICEMCYGRGADMETVAKAAGVTVNDGRDAKLIDWKANKR